MERIKIKFIDGEEIEFTGFYKGQVNPQGVLTNNWHYYEDMFDNVYHIRANSIKYVVSKGDD